MSLKKVDNKKNPGLSKRPKMLEIKWAMLKKVRWLKNLK
jgi:hypothetical protein